MNVLVVFAISLAAIIAVVVRDRWWLTRIHSWSMYPTFHPADCVPTRRLRLAERICRGDIVVIDSVELGRRVVKRVVGLPGEEVETGPRGVTIDGEALSEPYVAIHGGPVRCLRVPADAYLVLGDNRLRSSDSRCWATACVPTVAIRGRLTGRPLNRRACAGPRAAGPASLPSPRHSNAFRAGDLLPS